MLDVIDQNGAGGTQFPCSVLNAPSLNSGSLSSSAGYKPLPLPERLKPYVHRFRTAG